MPTFKISEDIRRELSNFKEYMRKQEYTNSSVMGYCTYLSRYLRHVDSKNANTLKETVETFLESERMDHPQTLLKQN